MMERNSDNFFQITLDHCNSLKLPESLEEISPPMKKLQQRSNSLNFSPNVIDYTLERPPETPSQALELLHSLSNSLNNSPKSTPGSSPCGSSGDSPASNGEDVQRSNKKVMTFPNANRSRKCFTPQMCPSPSSKPGEIIKRSRFSVCHSNQDTPTSLYTKGPSTFAAAMELQEQANNEDVQTEKVVESDKELTQKKIDEKFIAGGKFAKMSLKDMRDLAKEKKKEGNSKFP